MANSQAHSLPDAHCVAASVVPRGTVCHFWGRFFSTRYIQRDSAVHAHDAALRADVGGSSTHRARLAVRSHAAWTTALDRAVDRRALLLNRDLPSPARARFASS